MAGFQVSLPGWNGFFLVPADVVDRHLKLAPPHAIRALLYILRHGILCPSAEELAEALGVDKSLAEEALDYWAADGLLSAVEKPVVSPAPHGEMVCEDVSAASEPSAPAVVVKTGKMPGYSHAQLRDAFTSHPELRALFAAAEEIFARPLSDAVINLLYGLYDWFELPTEVIVTVLERCKDGGRLRPSAIKDEAENFYKNGAVTKEAACRYADELSQRDAAVDETVRVLAITDHSPYARERKAFENWRFAYGFDTDVVAVALEIAKANTESDSYSPELLPYMQKVLTNWYKGGVHTAEEARQTTRQKESGKGKASSGDKKSKSPSYDLDAEAKRAMARFSGKEDGTSSDL